MKWGDDQYEDLKFKIFDIVRLNLSEANAKKLTIKEFMDDIDNFIECCKAGKDVKS